MAELKTASSVIVRATSARNYTPSGYMPEAKSEISDAERLRMNRLGVQSYLMDRYSRGIQPDGTTPPSVWDAK